MLCFAGCGIQTPGTIISLKLIDNTLSLDVSVFLYVCSQEEEIERFLGCVTSLEGLLNICSKAEWLVSQKYQILVAAQAYYTDPPTQKAVDELRSLTRYGHLQIMSTEERPTLGEFRSVFLAAAADRQSPRPVGVPVGFGHGPSFEDFQKACTAAHLISTVPCWHSFFASGAFDVVPSVKVMCARGWGGLVEAVKGCVRMM